MTWQKLRYPPARRGDVVDDHHGTKVADPYRWLEDTDAEETRRWIAAQNELTESWLAEVELRDALRARLTELMDHPRAGAPWRRGDRWFQMRNTGLQNQDVLWTMPAADAEGEVLLDPNLLSVDGTIALTAQSVTEDGSLLAYATSEAGSDWLTWQVRDTETGQEVGETVRWGKFSGAAWAPDRSGYWYARYDEPDAEDAFEGVNLDHKLFFHRVGTPQHDDELVYARPDQPEWGFNPEISDDGRFLVITVWHGTQPNNRLYVIDLDQDPGTVVELLDAGDAGYVFAGSDGSVLYVRTDLDAPSGRVIAIDVEHPRREQWREVVAEADETLERVRLIGGRLLGVYLRHAAHRLRWFRLDGKPDGEIPLPGLGTVEAVTGRGHDPACCFTFSTFTEPTAVFRHDAESRATAVLHRVAIGLDPDALTTEQRFVVSAGERVPVFIVRRSDVTADGERPVWLHGYGGFQIPLTPAFNTEWLAWLERGGVLAVANLRGGGEYGRRWHDAGRLGNKQQVFDDAVAVAEWLIEQGWTRPGRIGIHGRSNGGLLAGACLTQRPDLFGAAVPEVGVLDMLRFHKFTIGWGWSSDYGTADEPEQFAWLWAYSPLHRIAEGTAYPPTLITTGDHDDRVVPAHSFKFAAALQAAQAGDAPVLIRIETDAGHGAGKPTDKLVAERADVVTFLVRTLGLESSQ
ncbi:MAG: prolyl oligopeptidase family serine peptidase [Nitriliruptorales bacterium]|nr:prolyl oligopeptidase family serine peptidase [Nitriliruptorales bacterium]